MVLLPVHPIRPERDYHIRLKRAEQVDADRIELGPTLRQLTARVVRDDHVTDSQTVGAGDGASPICSCTCQADGDDVCAAVCIAGKGAATKQGLVVRMREDPEQPHRHIVITGGTAGTFGPGSGQGAGAGEQPVVGVF